MGNNASAQRVQALAESLGKLGTADVPMSDTVWTDIFSAPSAHIDEIHSIVNAADVAKLRADRPANLARLLYQCTYVVHGFAVSKCTLFTAPLSSSDQTANDDAGNHSKSDSFAQPIGLAVSSALERAALSPPITEAACDIALALLARLLPLCLFSVASSGDSTAPPQPHRWHAEFAACVLFRNDIPTDSVTAADGADFRPIEPGHTLGATMVRSIVAAAFLPDYTITAARFAEASAAAAATVPSDDVASSDGTVSAEYFSTHVRLPLLWSPCMAADGAAKRSGLFTRGNSSSASDNSLSYPDIVRRRSLVLRALFGILSPQAYAADGLAPSRLRYTLNDVRVSPLAPTLMLSLLCTVANYQPFGSLPYASHWVSPAVEAVVRQSLQVLLVLCDSSVFPAAAAIASANSGEGSLSGDASEIDGHAAWGVVDNLPPVVASQVRSGILTLLHAGVYAQTSRFPGSQRAPPFRDELLLLLWKLCARSRRFRAAFVEDASAVQGLIVPAVAPLQPPSATNGPASATAPRLTTSSAETATRTAAMLQLSSVLLLLLTREPSFICAAAGGTITEALPFTALPLKGAAYVDLLLLSLLRVAMDESPLVSRGARLSAASAAANVLQRTPALGDAAATKVVSVVEALVRSLRRTEGGGVTTVVGSELRTQRATVLAALIHALAVMVQAGAPPVRPVLFACLRRVEIIRELPHVSATAFAALQSPVSLEECVAVVVRACDILEPEVLKRLAADPHAAPQQLLDGLVPIIPSTPVTTDATAATADATEVVGGVEPTDHAPTTTASPSVAPTAPKRMHATVPPMVHQPPSVDHMDAWAASVLWLTIFASAAPMFLEPHQVRIFTHQHVR
jgi:hypothetical protein